MVDVIYCKVVIIGYESFIFLPLLSEMAEEGKSSC